LKRILKEKKPADGNVCNAKKIKFITMSIKGNIHVNN